MTQGLLFASRVEREFETWIATPDGRLVEAEVVRRARALKAAGQASWGIAAIFEAIRYDRAIQLEGEGAFRLNNDRRSLLARRVMERHYDLRGFFQVRELRGAA